MASVNASAIFFAGKMQVHLKVKTPASATSLADKCD
jgi:hypothetical protein